MNKTLKRNQLISLLEEYTIKLTSKLNKLFGDFATEEFIIRISNLFTIILKDRIEYYNENREGKFAYFNSEEFIKFFLDLHLIYIDTSFYRLFISFLYLEQDYPDFYSKVVLKKGESNFFLYFLAFGDFCLHGTSKEIKERLYSKDYIIFWNELDHRIQLNELNKKVFIDLKEYKKYLLVMKTMYAMFKNVENQKVRKKLGAPSRVTWEILEDFGQRLEKAKESGYFKITDIYNSNSLKYKISNTTVRNWLRDKRPLLENKKKSNKDLTLAEIKNLWESNIDVNSL